MMQVLVAGFEPFGENVVNPTQSIAEDLGGVVLPVSYARAAEVLRSTIADSKPDVVICFGLAGDRRAITPERFAHNLDEAGTTDNEAAPGSGDEIEPGGPIACRSTVPVDDIVAVLRAAGFPAEPSRDAGGFLCNHVFYVLLRTLGRNQAGGFVHVPSFDVVPRDDMLRAARLVVDVVS